ncbi:MAG: ABC transporter permease [Candidatus Bathyarchaeia archaeon]
MGAGSPLGPLWGEYRRSKVGLAGLALFAALLAFSALAIAFVPLDSYRQWNNPSHWAEYPRAAPPAWTNWMTGLRLPEHMVLRNPMEHQSASDWVRVVTHTYRFAFPYESFPNDFIFKFSLKYGRSPPLVELSAERPDGVRMLLARISPPPRPEGSGARAYNSAIFSTDASLKVNLANYLAERLGAVTSPDAISPERMIFAKEGPSMAEGGTSVLKGDYIFQARFFLFGKEDEVLSSALVIGGKVFGLFGTDDLRRDLSVGILWGTPIALSIGISVAVLSVSIGIAYGVISGYYGGRLDELMMRLNDIAYAIPALPFLILLALSLGRSLLYIMAYLVLFGWVGIAKVARSVALQIKAAPYIEAVELLGAPSRRIIFRHIAPQLIPYAIANIALSVPAAILAEAGLSFLGLGDPTMPTWGQILHDAQLHGAAIRGLWWWALSPGIMLAGSSLAFVMIGYALERALNPRIRGA